MKLSEFAQDILFGEELESKLFTPAQLEYDFYNEYELPENPGRSSTIAFSNEQVKFPQKKSLKVDTNKAKALHFFANHELLAIEMMAAALICYPTKNLEDIKFKKGIVLAIKDEQKHFKLYRNRMNELGVEFGDIPLNDFFWRQMKYLKTPSEFFALMSMTFEMANLDFCIHYIDIFTELNDTKTMSIMKTVLEDEITHVSLGRYWLEQWKPSGRLWDYYKSLLPEKISPSRAKGIIFSRQQRSLSGLDTDYIDALDDYRDDFAITTRKTWES